MNPQTFKELADLYTSSAHFSTLAPNTQKKDIRAFDKLISVGGDMEVYYTPDHTRTFEQGGLWFKAIATINGGLSNHQRNYYRRYIKALYAWANRSIGLPLGTCPATNIPVLAYEAKETMPFTRSDIQKVVEYRKATRNAYTKSELIASYFTEFLFETGMRPSEALRLRVEDIVLDHSSDESILNEERLIAVIGAKKREQGKVSRYLAVTPAVEACIKYFMTNRATIKPEHDLLICSVKGLTYNLVKITETFKKVLKKAGVVSRQMYDLRRGCATEIIHNPLYGITVAQKQLGHQNITTTQLYENLNKIQAAKLFKGHNQ